MPSTPHAKHAPRRRLPEERPQQIIEAAFAVFGEQGLANARLDDIARRAGLAKGTIYLYFPNKEALFEAMVRHKVVARLEEAEREMGSGGFGGTATHQLRAFLRAWWAFLCSPVFQTIYPLVIGELTRCPDLVRFYAEEVVARTHRLVADIVQRGVASGEFRAVEPLVAARMLSSAVISHANWMGRHSIFAAFTPRTTDEALDQITEFFLHALRPDGPSAHSRPS